MRQLPQTGRGGPLLRSIATCVRALVGCPWLAMAGSIEVHAESLFWHVLPLALQAGSKFWIVRDLHVNCPEDPANSLHALADCCVMTNCACDQSSFSLTTVRDEPHGRFMTWVQPKVLVMKGHELKGE